MFQSILQVAFLATALISSVSAECANACNGHGKCTSYDMCICNRNWQAADCSERVCQFGLAHVDTPKGDLDASGVLTKTDNIVVDNHYAYPYGTTEQFPQMQDSDLQDLPNSAHYYMECSNKGTCDRSTGECVCYDGYDGVACQRASCPGYPNSCSGHGVCKTKRQLASADHGNVYKLWDADVTMGCECDPGYGGPDCSERKCKHGVDPLYLDDSATVKYSIFDFATLTTAKTVDFTDGHAQTKTGYWAIRYFDNHGEDWLTRPIRAGASCTEVIDALENIPNNVIPSGFTYCTKVSKTTATNENNWNVYDAQHNDWTHTSPHRYVIYYNLSIWEAVTPANQGETSYYTAVTDYNSSSTAGVPASDTALTGYIYRLKFYGNPGAVREPEIEIYLDGKRPSLVSKTTGAKTITKVWTDGQQGESNDYFADHCDGVTVTISNDLKVFYFTGMTKTEKNLLKKCLGASDFDTGNNVEVYNWDYGSMLYPHFVKLVRTVTVYTDGGYYAAIWFDSSTTKDNSGTSGTFRLLNPFIPPDTYSTDNYEVYTTRGTLALTSNHSQAVMSFGSKNFYMVNSSYDEVYGTAAFDGDISCEVGNNNVYKLKYIHHCLNKTDLFTVLNWDYPYLNPPHINLYTAQRLQQNDFTHRIGDRNWKRTATALSKTYEMHYMTHQVTTDLSSNWGAYHGFGNGERNKEWNYISNFRVYKFFPNTTSTYNYVNECSNRGICQTDTGLCSCFPGYTNDDCSVQSSIAL